MSNRSDRDYERGRRAADVVRAAGGTAMAAAVAHIEATFSRQHNHNSLKLRVEQAIKFGAEHPETRARYGARARLLLGGSIDVAIARVERWHRDEQRAHMLLAACRFGRPSAGGSLSLTVLGELRLLLRLLRIKHVPFQPLCRKAADWRPHVFLVTEA